MSDQKGEQIVTITGRKGHYKPRTYHTDPEGCMVVGQSNTTRQLPKHELTDNRAWQEWRECKHCSGEGDSPMPTHRPCPLCGESSGLLGKHLAACSGSESTESDDQQQCPSCGRETDQSRCLNCGHPLIE